MTSPSRNSHNAVSKISLDDWQQLLNSGRDTRTKVTWRITITDVSFFGGFYVKGHLLETKSARVHLIWPPEATPSGAARAALVEGGTLTIQGVFEGVTTDKEAIISVTRYE